MKFNEIQFTDCVYKKAALKRMTVREAAKEIGISTATFSRLQNYGTPDIESLYKVCKWLKKPMESFFTSK